MVTGTYYWDEPCPSRASGLTHVRGLGYGQCKHCGREVRERTLVPPSSSSMSVLMTQAPWPDVSTWPSAPAPSLEYQRELRRHVREAHSAEKTKRPLLARRHYEAIDRLGRAAVAESIDTP